MFPCKAGVESTVSIRINSLSQGQASWFEGDGWMYLDEDLLVRESKLARQHAPLIEVNVPFVGHFLSSELRGFLESRGERHLLDFEFRGKHYPRLIDLLRDNDPVIEEKALEVERQVLLLCNKLILAGCVNVHVDFRSEMFVIFKHNPSCFWSSPEYVFAQAYFFGNKGDVDVHI